MKVAIVAKTRMGSGACVGGITFDGRSVRLVAADAESNDRFNHQYNVGEVWELVTRPATNLLPPHVENVIVENGRRLPALDNITAFIEQHMPPVCGGPELLFEGLTQSTNTGALYIAQASGIPSRSTMFWRPDRPLLRETSAKRVRYYYPGTGVTLTFVGFQEPVETIPAGTLLRVSLAHWWRPPEEPEHELRCYVQLSGWFFPEESHHWWMPDELAWDMEEMPEEPPAVFQPVILPQEVPTGQLTMKAARQTLKHIFGFDDFRPLQAEIVQHLLDKKDALAVMPTGSGKSLCYQLPALLFPGLTVVVSPLISLMQDQVEQLRQLGIPAVFLNSTLSYHDYLEATEQIRNGSVMLLYAAPETLLRPETMLLLEECRVDCLTIDEAHCISEWGHDFRPEYRQLVDLRRRLPTAVCIAVTATATERVRQDIKTTLGVPDAGEFIASFDRENLMLSVVPKMDGLAQTLAFLAAHRDESGIIYCTTRKQVDTLTEQLNANDWPAVPYHAGLDDATRFRHQRQFTHDEVPLVVATIAFGMGINKSNVRFILHYDLPKNLESYYQQIGRAGRDGLPAECQLLFSHGDVQTIQFLINQQEESQQRGARIRLDAMLGFVDTKLCRRRPLLDYFGETYTAENCEACDNCLREEEELVDLTIASQKFLSCVKRTGEKFGMSHVIDVLRGSRSKKVLHFNHHQLSTYNIGREFSKKEWQHLARQFIQQGLMTQHPEIGNLQLTTKAYAVFKGEPVYGTLLQEPRHHVADSGGEHDRALFRLLQAKRKELAEEAGVPPYVIFSDRSLVEMATYFPHSPEAFATIHGIGRVKVQRYADDFLPIIRDYCSANGLSEQIKRGVLPATVALVDGHNRTSQVLSRYNAGRTIPELAAEFSVTPRTIIGHLWRAIQAGASLRSDNLLAYSTISPAEQQEALDAFATLGTGYLRPVYEALGERVSFDELHVLRLYAASQEKRPEA